MITASKSVEETEKRLGSVLLGGVPIISLDNCTHDLGGELLCQLSERPVVKIRILGQSAMPDCECHTAVFATGNNIGFKGDMVRRGLVCNLEALANGRSCVNSITMRSSAPPPIGVTISPPRSRSFGPISRRARHGFAARSAVMRPGRGWCAARWSGWAEPDPVSSMDLAREEDPVLTDIRELFDLWINYELGLDTPYTPAASSRSRAGHSPQTTSTRRSSSSSCCASLGTGTVAFRLNAWGSGCGRSVGVWLTDFG